ncbi:uncharacterized protein LOC114268521 [Camellia sinensis]|uniref:uncharacterized protein LOC114268521 n=1 Tax=Camellia sinensis TaxID=4442 RepID=UPI001035A868|nr:uncharacterized protein LOC114268521 [Camellia sinensis]
MESNMQKEADQCSKNGGIEEGEGKASTNTVEDKTRKEVNAEATEDGDEEKGSESVKEKDDDNDVGTSDEVSSKGNNTVEREANDVERGSNCILDTVVKESVCAIGNSNGGGCYNEEGVVQVSSSRQVVDRTVQRVDDKPMDTRPRLEPDSTLYDYVAQFVPLNVVVNSSQREKKEKGAPSKRARAILRSQAATKGKEDDQLELSDSPMQGRSFAWCNAMKGDKWSRIDRFLVDHVWLERFQLKQWGLSRCISDHCPVLLMEDERDGGPKHFWFINAWELHPKFKIEVKKSWEESQLLGWKAEDELHEWDLKAEVRSLLETELERRREIRSKVWKLSRYKERIWLQKSRLTWAHNSDKNTRLFHLMASRRQRKNLLGSVKVNGVEFEDPTMKSRPKLSGPFLSISLTDSKDVLEAKFSEAEIWVALKITMEFHSNGKMAKGVNSSFITLIPKKENPSDLSEYRPISLVSSVYKVLAKVLCTRLRQVLPKLIGEVQTAFLGGRCILDGVLIANEVVDWWRKSKKKGIILKSDFEKVYDSVNWEFLSSMMANFGFCEKWVGWIKSCISTSRISVLVNRSPTTEFSSQKGLRQGDFLSPFLFNIVAEGLNLLLDKAKEKWLIRGASVGPKELKISHLQFADDTIIFCKAK